MLFIMRIHCRPRGAVQKEPSAATLPPVFNIQYNISVEQELRVLAILESSEVTFSWRINNSEFKLITEAKSYRVGVKEGVLRW